MNATAAAPDSELTATHLPQARGTVRRRAARTDVALGLVLALLAFALAPGLAVAAIIASALLVLCGLSVLFARRRSRRHAGGGAGMRLRSSGRARPWER
jgi:predicted branched-subunit amino acid permease